MQTSNDLRALLQRIDRRSYPAYKDTRGPISSPAMSCPSTMSRGTPSPPPPG